MAIYGRFFKYNALRSFVLVSGKLFASVTSCQSSSSKDNRRQQKVHLFGSPAALPGGSSDSSFFKDHKEWEVITFGPYFGAALDNENNVYIWGRSSNKDYKDPFTSFKLDGVKDIQCSNDDIYFLKSNGTVYVLRNIMNFLNNGEGIKPEKVDLPSSSFSFGAAKVVKMSVGSSHTALVTEDGSLYCLGNNDYGQCGLKPSNITRESTFLVYHPQVDQSNDVLLNRVKFNENVKILDVVCGGKHTVCLDSENNIYTFGDDSSVQLFLGDTRGRSLLEKESYKEYFKKHEGRNDTLVAYGQKERHLQYNPVKINDVGPLKRFKELINNSEIKITAGDDFTIIVVTTKDGGSTMFASGGNKYGQCGRIGLRMDKIQATKLPNGSKINSITCGSNHCIALLEKGLLAWGNNTSRQLIIPKNGYITNPEFVNVPRGHLDELAKNESSKEIKYVKCAYNNTAIVTF